MFGRLRERVSYEVGRIVNAVGAGYALYRDEDLFVDGGLWDTYEARMGRYRLNTLYLENKQYSPFARLHYWGRFTGRYKKMRAIYNPVSRLVDLEVNKTYGGRIDWDGNLKTGAIPIVLSKEANPKVTACVKQILKWSNFGDGKDLYVRNGSTLGDSFLKNVTVFKDEERTQGDKVYIEVLDPHKVKDFDLDERGNVRRIVIEYEDIDFDPITGKERKFLYREVIDRDTFKIWRHYGALPVDLEKRAPDEDYPNTYGFVPATHTPHKHVVGGKKSGVTSFHNTLTKVDEQNDGASVAKDGSRKANNPALVVKGGKLGTINTELKERDEMIVFEGGDPEMSIETLTPVTDTPGAIATMEREDNEIQSDNPALALQNLRKQGGELSGVAIENYYGDASDSLEAIQGRYDERLIRILQMAMTMAGMIGCEGFPFTLDSYPNGEMEFSIKERKVFSDRVPTQERIQLILQAVDSPAWPIIARELDVSEEDIEYVLLMKAEKEARDTANAMRGVLDQFDMGEDEDEMIAEEEEQA